MSYNLAQVEPTNTAKQFNPLSTWGLPSVGNMSQTRKI